MQTAFLMLNDTCFSIVLASYRFRLRGLKGNKA